MKKVIDRKVYNTETAEEIHSWDNGIYGNDFRSCSETLYKTKKGSFFLWGKGGPMSSYARHYGNTTSGGEDIIPMTADEAIDWLESHGGEDVIVEQFSDSIEEA